MYREIKFQHQKPLTLSTVWYVDDILIHYSDKFLRGISKYSIVLILYHQNMVSHCNMLECIANQILTPKTVNLSTVRHVDDILIYFSNKFSKVISKYSILLVLYYQNMVSHCVMLECIMKSNFDTKNFDPKYCQVY
jgi:hypothetical protein